MEDDLKILKVEILSKHFLDHTQMLNLSLDDLTIFYKYLNEDYLKILKMEYLSNHLLDHDLILNLSFDDQTLFYESLNEDDLQWKTTSKY